MRTTLTLDTDILHQLKALGAKRNLSFKAVVNETLRRGLKRQEGSNESPPFEVIPHQGGFKPGVDPAKLNQLLDELEIEDCAANDYS